MKIGGIDPKTLPNEDCLVLPRGDASILFRARGLANLDDFHNMVPEPKAPGKMTPNGYVPDINEPGYTVALAEYQKRRLGYLVFKTLEPSEIEWDTVNPDIPGTWGNWDTDLKENGLTNIECGHVLKLVLETNSLDENKLKKAREVFLLGLKPALAT